GFLAGSLVMVWPWREPTIATDNGHADALRLLAPSQYAQAVGDAQLFAALGLMIVGFVVVMLLEYVGARRESL
ncbi:MAG: DUF368 domain-containing protein, partial [Gammaproteobacteria bacterium]|nr:DUF368 domain-containing protein [Gammaproteobacteria bacterium]